MKKDSTPWAYRKGTGFLYRLPVGFKLLFFLGLSVAVFFFGNFMLPLTALIIIFFSANARIPPWELLRGGASLLILCLGIIAFQTFDFFPLGINALGLLEGIFLGLRMGLSFSAGALLFSTTTMGEIQKSLSRLEALLHVRKLRLSLGISLMLGFLPRFFEIWDDMDFAWKSRGGKNGPFKIAALIPLAIDRMVEKAAQTAEALESRGF